MTHDEVEQYARDIAKVASQERAIVFEAFPFIWGAGRMALFPTKTRDLLPSRKKLRKRSKQ